MIDVHSHILAGLDDGASRMDDSLEMARQAVEEGIRLIYATPHHLEEHYNYDIEKVFARIRVLNDRLSKEGIELTVRPGQEIRINGDLVQLLKDREALTLGDAGKYVLLELPSKHVPEYTKRILFDVQVAGYQPIIAHPERNKELMEHPELLYRLVRNGVLTQVTAASIAGKFGNKLQKFCLDLIDANLVHFVASDAHNVSSRSFFLNEAWDQIESTFGKDMVYYFKENAEVLAENGHVVGEQPMHVRKKKKIFGVI